MGRKKALERDGTGLGKWMHREGYHGAMLLVLFLVMLTIQVRRAKDLLFCDGRRFGGERIDYGQFCYLEMWSVCVLDESPTKE